MSGSDWWDKIRKRYEELYPRARAEKSAEPVEELKTDDGTPLHEAVKKAIPHPKKRRKLLHKLITKTVRGVAHLRKQDPDWWTKTIIACLGNQLAELKTLIEDPEEKEVSWENPWIETRYPVRLQTDSTGSWGGTTTKVKPLIPGLPNEEDFNPTNPEQLEEVIYSGLHLVEYDLFQKLTRYLAYRKRGDEVDFLIPGTIYGDLGAQIEKDREELPEEHRARHIELTNEGLFQPFTLFLGRCDWVDELRQERMIDALEEKTGWSPFIHQPDVGISGTDEEGHEFDLTLVLEVYPLVIEEDEKDGHFLQAYYPVVAGFMVWGDGPGPAKWKPDEQESLWEAIFHLIWRLQDELKEGAEEEKAQEAAPPAQETKAKTETTFTDETGEKLRPLSEESLRQLDEQFGDRLKEQAGPPRTFPLALPSYARMSNEAEEIIKHVHRVRLPSKWSTLPRWEQLVQDYIEDLLANEGERAFQNIRGTTGDPEEHGPLLKRRHKAGGEEEVFLTREAEQLLRKKHGLGRGFIEVKGIGQQYLVRIFETPQGGLLEIGLSWAGLAGPLVDEWREKRRQQLEEEKRKWEAPLLFEDLDAGERRRLDALMEQARLWDDGRRVMEMVLGQVSAQHKNPVEIPAEAFRVLLWPNNARTRTYSPQWKRRVDGILSALHAMTFFYRTHGSESAKGYGSFIGEWDYIGRGKGGHGDGVYVLDVQPGFLGCLRLFESTKTRLRSGREALYLDFGKDLSKDEKGELSGQGGYLTFDAGRAFYNSAAGFTPSQENLVKWIDHELTKKRDRARKENKGRQVRPNAPDANSPRVYDRAFCPLLPEGRSYYGTLGHFDKNPEAGFTLGGTGSRLSRHTAGILAELGYRLPSGPWCARKDEVLKSALGDLKAVVVEYFGGVVAGRLGNEWIPLERFRDLNEKELCHKLKVLCFVPEDYRSRHRANFEEATGYRVTENQKEAERAAWEVMDGEEEDMEVQTETAAVPEIPDNIPSVRNAFRGLPLRERLQEVMKRRKVSGAALASLFGVSKMTVSYWITGKKPIAEDAVPLLVRWIESGTAPTAEELAARRRHP